ncbi:MAG TPA: hypothetical protein VLA04_02290 [Verrucomicrobiae bacterium]|nr:hypothetical protein [Verrucomicrobiae bacterium]
MRRIASSDADSWWYSGPVFRLWSQVKQRSSASKWIAHLNIYCSGPFRYEAESKEQEAQEEYLSHIRHLVDHFLKDVGYNFIHIKLHFSLSLEDEVLQQREVRRWMSFGLGLAKGNKRVHLVASPETTNSLTTREFVTTCMDYGARHSDMHVFMVDENIRYSTLCALAARNAFGRWIRRQRRPEWGVIGLPKPQRMEADMTNGKS